jgi:hypothetical protein
MNRVVQRAIQSRERSFEPRRIERICHRLARTLTRSAYRAGCAVQAFVDPDVGLASRTGRRFDHPPTRFMHNAGQGDEIVLPYRPLWSGLVANTLFYAALVGLLLVGTRHRLRALRLRHGLCPTCKYPIGTSGVCTECGASLAHPAST